MSYLTLTLTDTFSYSGYLGFQFTVSGSSDLGVDWLGRYVLNGNTQPHNLVLLDSNGTLLRSATLSTIGAAPGQFSYQPLGIQAGYPWPTLYRGSTYYLMSQETQNTDQWYGWPGTVLTSGIATINSATASSSLSTFINYPGSSGEGFVPVDLKWFNRPVVGGAAVAGSIISDINAIINPQGYSVTTVDLTEFANHIR